VGQCNQQPSNAKVTAQFGPHSKPDGRLLVCLHNFNSERPVREAPSRRSPDQLIRSVLGRVWVRATEAAMPDHIHVSLAPSCLVGGILMSPIRKQFTHSSQAVVQRSTSCGCTNKKFPKLQIMKEAGWDERLLQEWRTWTIRQIGGACGWQRYI
jgi:hypothetical protein